jgi:hypothetical protein
LLESALLDRIRQIRDIASRHGGTVVFDLPPPARAGDITTCEGFFGSALPPAYPPESLVPAFMLAARSTTSAVVASQSLRDFFADMRLTGNEGFSEAEARHYVDFVDFDDSDRFTLLDLKRLDPSSGEAPVIDVNNEDWFNIELLPIAWSVDDFITRCFDFMIETECGFRYWRGPEDGW